MRSSNDNADRWTLLRRHDGDATLAHAGAFGAWPVTGAAAGRAWSRFRIVSTGPHAGAEAAASGPQARALALSGVEFYGSLFVGEKAEMMMMARR